MRLGVDIGRELWAFAHRCRDRLENEHGLTVHPSTDADAFMRTVAFIRGEPTNITSPYHPDYSVLDERNSWWSKLCDDTGQTVSYTMHRLIQTDDFIEDYALGRLFADGPPNFNMGLPTLVDNPRIPPLAGNIVLAGGLWVTEGRRDEGIVRTYSPMGQALSLIRFKWDYFCILQRYDATVQDRPRLGYGFKRSEPLSTGIYPPYGKELDIAIAWKSRQEFIEDIRGTK